MRRLAVVLPWMGLVLVAPIPAQAGLFEMLFGRQTPSRPPAAYAPPMSATTMPAASTPVPSGGTRVFCVRLCDGFYFPLDAAGRSPEAMCAASCEGAETAVFRGTATAVESALDSRGRRYGELPAAFAYRTALRDGCGCRRADGYVALMRRILDDPTLRKGDIVVTRDGASVFSPAAASRDAWSGSDFVDARRPGAMPAAAWKLAERILGSAVADARRGEAEPIRTAERRSSKPTGPEQGGPDRPGLDIVVTPLRRLEPRVVMDAPFER